MPSASPSEVSTEHRGFGIEIGKRSHQGPVIGHTRALGHVRCQTIVEVYVNARKGELSGVLQDKI